MSCNTFIFILILATPNSCIRVHPQLKPAYDGNLKTNGFKKKNVVVNGYFFGEFDFEGEIRKINLSTRVPRTENLTRHVDDPFTI